MNAAVEADRALLRRRAEELPTVGLCAVAATTDELVDPLVLPTRMAVDDDVVEDVPGVLRAVRGRLQQAAASLASVPEAMACARAARQLAAADLMLAGSAR
jgi:hypothetical protein